MRQTVKDWRDKTIVEVDAHVMIEGRFGFERRDAEISERLICCLEQFIYFTIGLMGVNKLSQFGLKRFEIGGLLRLGHQLGDE